MKIKKCLCFICDIFFLLRPTLMIPVWTIFFLGWVTAGPCSPFSFLALGASFWTLFLLFTMVVGNIYVVNQIRDVESDRMNEKLFILPGGHVSLKSAWIFSWCLLGFSLGGAWFLLDNKGGFFIILLATFLGYFYNCPPFELKNRPWGGLCANSFGHGVLTYFAGWYAYHANTHITPELVGTGLIYSLAAGFANGAVYLTSTIPDTAGDAAVGKRTFSVVYGERSTALLAFFLVLFASLASLLLPYNKWIMLLPGILSIPLFWRLYHSNNVAETFKTFRWPVVLLSVTVSFFLPVYGLLVLGVVFLSRWYYRARFGIEYPSFSKE